MASQDTQGATVTCVSTTGRSTTPATLLGTDRRQRNDQNDRPDTLRFKLADDHFFSLNFTAVNTRNQPLPQTEKWIRERSTSKQVYFREISLEPGIVLIHRKR
jgi:hypothetical protein